MKENFDLVVIGGGPGGYEAALEAARLGMKTAVVEKDAIGGTCLNRGCIPTKTLLHSAGIYREAKTAEDPAASAVSAAADRQENTGAAGLFGVHMAGVTFSMEEMQTRKADVISQLQAGILGQFKRAKVLYFHGLGTILGPRRVQVTPTDGESADTAASAAAVTAQAGEGVLSAGQSEPVILHTRNILAATGSCVSVPPIPGADLPGVMTSNQLLNRKTVPEHLIIIGGGVIGMEFASLYTSLGKKVTVIEALDRILATMDREIAQNLKMILIKRGADIHTKSMVKEIRAAGPGSGSVLLTCAFEEKGALHEVTGDAVLLAVGRRPYTKGLLADGVELAMERGRILTDTHYRTSMEGVYAIGDVTGGIMLAHAATAEGRNAVHFIAADSTETSMPAKNTAPPFAFPFIDTAVIPACVYTDPEIAAAGLTGDAAKAAKRKVIVKKYPMSANAKTLLTGQERGFIKILADAESHQILGAVLMCARATDMIGELAEAIVHGLTMEDLARVVRPHPTFEEAVAETIRG